MVPNVRGEYLSVRLCYEGRRDKISVHRLVAETHVPNPHNLPQVNHINLDTFDNRSSNLEWVTAQKNCQRRGNNKIQEGEEVEIRTLYSSGLYKQAELAEKFGCSVTQISRVVNFKQRK